MVNPVVNSNFSCRHLSLCIFFFRLAPTHTGWQLAEKWYVIGVVVGQHCELIQVGDTSSCKKMHGLSRKLCFRFDIITDVSSFCVMSLTVVALRPYTTTGPSPIGEGSTDLSLVMHQEQVLLTFVNFTLRFSVVRREMSSRWRN